MPVPGHKYMKDTIPLLKDFTGEEYRYSEKKQKYDNIYKIQI